MVWPDRPGKSFSSAAVNRGTEAASEALAEPEATCVEARPSQTMLRSDRRFDYGEERWVAVGPIRDRLHVVVYVVRQDGHRLVSLRRANSREGRFHAAAIDRTDA